MKDKAAFSSSLILFTVVFVLSICTFSDAGSSSGDYPSKAGLESITRGAPVKSASEKVKSGVSNETRAQKYGFEMSTNRYGEDYRDFDIPVADPRLCAEVCAEEADCKAWTMVKPGIQGEQAKCWLKSKVPQPEKDDCCISGLKSR
ncbi:MAG: hypothetical protein COZ70_06285 [Deltaproteobacteria bacterium CG_4_8_14_3_um_filter_51_11]|nr:hypothetical protein [bacterium]OIP42467.1 MAG: hypothetical protein AUK25_03855 [Desulfobacteraceae bacterium CG2_30_51_40]PIP46088.1 MAG: hypothetical protein COX16_10095 [Deltaproteobacteria bacterium CG23_combo_of_CG06-09_8_20_14_all_51_20]PIX19929.1 MAG: hypothetical protein COZ70_06285 [Deltaproteobacteria bacterium CG_4_8_14_3_um_filter_51_11]PIY23781.1 MAG: hypothetical protein COZ11_08970 [Deltaproteobacteria bacterium CG_4_10_14_3_um_filter_51_14]PJB37198.1 MAG: hypothetical prote